MSRVFGEIKQLAYVVKDAKAVMREWAEHLGVGPFFYFRDFEVANYRYRGKPGAAPILTLGFANSGGLQIEVIEQQNDVPSGYLDSLRGGPGGAQHVCAWPESTAAFDAKRAELLAKGYTIVHEGASPGGAARFNYFETNLPDRVMFEISEAMIPGMREFQIMIAEASVGWDGTDPLRDVTHLLTPPQS